jgi:hypothetical protein
MPKAPRFTGAKAKWFFSLSGDRTPQELLDTEPEFLRSKGVPVWGSIDEALVDLNPEFKGTIYDYEVTVRLVGKRNIV